jgi:hypothetical protein
VNGYTLRDNGPTLGDLIDCELASERNDAYAIYRLLDRWLSPKPSVDTIRAMAMSEAREHVKAIVERVRRLGVQADGESVRTM